MRVGAASGESFGADEDRAAWLSPLTLNWRGEGNGEKTSIFLLWQPTACSWNRRSVRISGIFRRAARL